MKLFNYVCGMKKCKACESDIRCGFTSKDKDAVKRVRYEACTETVSSILRSLRKGVWDNKLK